MRFLSRLILMSICFELMISPIKPELVMVTVLKANAAETCAQGMEWSDAANRCLVNATTAQTQRDLEACAKEADPKACYERNANNAAGTTGQFEGENLSSKDIQGLYRRDSGLSNTIKTATYALPLILFGYTLFRKKARGTGNKRQWCLPPSTIAMMVAGATMLGGEVYGFIKHNKNLKKLDEARNNLFTPKSTDNLDQKKVDATQMQSEAFQLLADEQASVSSLAGTKSTFYWVAMSAFTASAGIATYEMLAIRKAKIQLASAMISAKAEAAADTTGSKAAILTNLETLYGTGMKYSKAKDIAEKRMANQLKDAQEKVTKIDKKIEENSKLKDPNSTNKKQQERVERKDQSLAEAKTTAQNEVNNLEALKKQAEGTFPKVAQASVNLKNLLVKYECWQDTSDETKAENSKKAAEQLEADKNNCKTRWDDNSNSCISAEDHKKEKIEKNVADERKKMEEEKLQKSCGPGETVYEGACKPYEDVSRLECVKNGGKWSNGRCDLFPKNTKIYKDLKNLKQIYTQIHNIKNAQSVEELHLLSEELELIKNGGVESFYEDTFSKKDFTSYADKIYLQVHSELTAMQTYSEFFNEDLEISSETINEKILSIIENNIGFPKAHAGGGGGLIAIGTAAIPFIAGALGIFKGKSKDGYSTPGSQGNQNAASGSSGQSSNNPSIEDIDKNTSVKEFGGKMDQFLMSPKFRIGFGAVMGGLTAFMANDMGKMKKKAKERQELLLTLKGDFENTQGMKICSPQERNDQNQPGCYCYTAEGTRNMSRSASAICQNMWNSVNLNGSSYLSSSDLNGKVCITQSNAIDEKCSCRTSNTCLKASGFNISGISLGTLSALGSGLAPIATASSGNGAELNTDAIVNGAMKLRDATDKVLAGNDLKNENAIVKAAEKSLGNFVQANGGTLGSPSASRSVPSSLANFDAKAALEEIKKEVEASPDIKGAANSGIGFDSGSSTEPALEFGLTEEEAAIQEEQVAEVLKQDMDLGNNDISGSSTNLFEVLSHRYKRSGMRRLFDTEGKTEAEKPAETDINK